MQQNYKKAAHKDYWDLAITLARLSDMSLKKDPSPQRKYRNGVQWSIMGFTAVMALSLSIILLMDAYANYQRTVSMTKNELYNMVHAVELQVESVMREADLTLRQTEKMLRQDEKDNSSKNINNIIAVPNTNIPYFSAIVVFDSAGNFVHSSSQTEETVSENQKKLDGIFSPEVLNLARIETTGAMIIGTPYYDSDIRDIILPVGRKIRGGNYTKNSTPNETGSTPTDDNFLVASISVRQAFAKAFSADFDGGSEFSRNMHVPEKKLLFQENGIILVSSKNIADGSSLLAIKTTPANILQELSHKLSENRMGFINTASDDLLVFSASSRYPLIVTATLAQSDISRNWGEVRFYYLLMGGAIELWLVIVFFWFRSRLIKQQNAESRLHQLAYIDPLTGISNRFCFLEKLQETTNKRDLYAVLIIGIDRFRQLHNGLGHDLTNDLLIAFSKYLTSLVNESDDIARLGSGEFSVVVRVSEGAIGVERKIRQLDELTNKPFMIGERQVFLTTSMGIAMAEPDAGPAELMRNAEIAISRARQKGGDHIVFDQAMRDHLIKKHQLESDLRTALVSPGQIIVVYQPIIRLSDGKLSGFEALVRWKHPQRGMISPLDFISLAEETGLIIPLGMQVARTACQQLAEWLELRSKTDMDLFMAVNLSPRQFSDHQLYTDILQILRQTGLKPEQLKLEITESTLFGNHDEALSLLRSFRNLGVRLAIDDFGTGYSSLSYLHKLPIDELKIDRSFITAMNGSRDNFEIVRTIIALSRLLHMKVTAEGIENADDLSSLQGMECDFGQGYHISAPVPAETITPMLERPFLVKPNITSIEAVRASIANLSAL
ncbi:MAG: bifunctional diguanylate cyclase/phosphodiesterase [Alphaproteobacteria bacterium]